MPTKLSAKKAKKSGGDYALRRMIGDTPLREAVAPLRLLVKDKHNKIGAERDPIHCLVANAAKDQLGSKIVFFLRSVAYVETLDEATGAPVIERFELPKKGTARKLIAAYDRGESLELPAMVTLTVPAPSRTVAAMRKSTKRRADRRKAGVPKDKRRSKAAKRAAQVRLKQAQTLDVRDGAGMVHTAV